MNTIARASFQHRRRGGSSCSICDLNSRPAFTRPTPERGFLMNATTLSLNVDGDRVLRFAEVTLRDLITLAFGVGAPQPGTGFSSNGGLNAPADRFDVAAKVPLGATREQVPLMLRALLTERFHLSLHREINTIQVFALQVAK